MLLIKEDFHNDSQRPDSPATSDSGIDESHDLTDKELQMFKKNFSYKSPEELEEALIGADTEKKKKKKNELLNDLNIKQNVLCDQIKTNIGVSRTGLENLANVVKNILDNVGLYNNMPDLASEESTVQGKKQEAAGLKILSPSQMLSTLTISLAQLKGGNNSEKLENEIRQLLYSLYR